MAAISHRKSASHFVGHADQVELVHREASESPQPHAIVEVPEPASPDSTHSSQHSRCHSALTELIKNSPPTEEGSHDSDEEEAVVTAGFHPVTVREGIISQPGEQTALLARRTAYGSIKDIESQKTSNEVQKRRKSLAIQQVKDRFGDIVRVARNPKSWNRHAIWEYGVRQPTSLVPPVILGLLLNVLDALSYG